ncbi:MAG: mannose-1-phosphate guanyltransferase, partial [Actinomycetota bacterium]
QERKASRSLFGARGVSGLVNIGLTPQVAVRLGMAYGTMLPRGASVITGRDASRAARTIKRALIAGLTSTGVICRDLELMALPVTRFAVRKQQAEGGVSVRTSRWDSEVVEIRLFDAEGADVSESVQRKIDRIFFREDYRRPGANRLGELDFPPHVLEQYTGALLGSIDLESVRRTSLKVVVDYASGAASLIGPSLLGRLGCRALSVNAFTDEHRPVFGREHLERLLGDLREHVTKSGSDLGVLLEPGGETAHLVDDRGRLVSHEQALLAFLRHELERGAGTAAVPVSSSAAAVDVAREAGGELELTPVGHPALMAATLKPGIGFAGDSEGSLIFPGFMPAPDALMTFCKALEMITSSGRPLAELIDDLPPSHVASRSVRTPWQLKGTVMREIASEASPSELLLVDGVKIVERGRWALVIPAPDEPSCRIWAEAADDDASAEHAQSYVERVERVVKAAEDKSTN